tara:strand:+ start:28795 stop:29010 length:216 start_codon:yes stop_codon:yes gene_type:complete
MKIGDLVKLNITQDKVPGALTAVKYVMALEKQFGGNVGLVVETPGDYVVVRFPTGLKMIEKKFLEQINECG